MKSPFTGKEMQLVREQRTMPFRKENFEYVHHAYRCDETKEQFTTTELDELNIFQVYNHYREKHNIPFPEEIKAIRAKYGVSATKMSEILGFGTNSYRLYEDGEVPQLSNAKSIISASNIIGFRLLVDNCEKLTQSERDRIYITLDKLEKQEHQIIGKKHIEEYLIGAYTANHLTGYKLPSLEKFSGMVSLFASALEPFKTKLNKLLFYADFAMFKQHGHSISGLRYRAIDMGPVPNNFQSIFEYLQTNNVVNVTFTSFNDGKIGEQYFSNSKYQIDHKLFNDIELTVINEVIITFKKDNASSIIKKSHEEKAWIEPFQTKDLIPYTYAFQLKHI